MGKEEEKMRKEEREGNTGKNRGRECRRSVRRRKGGEK